MSTVVVLPQTPFRELCRWWERHLRAANRSWRTIESYLESAEQLFAFLQTQRRPVDLVRIRPVDVEAFVSHVLAIHKPATAAIRYPSLQQFFRWLVEEDEIRANPMARMKPPKVAEQSRRCEAS